MTEVDCYDDSIVRYVIRRHQYDPETRHFRWLYESAYDNKKEYTKRLQEAFDELHHRQMKNEAHLKEQVSGSVLEVGYFSDSKSRRERHFAQGAYRPVNWKTRFLFRYLSIKPWLNGRMQRRY